ncbi:MAG: phosphonate ABC transporter, permease protein PhnE [Hyphomicrobiales bacterium]|nr:phosphonate ABC transporter, permease protein PhnE [Hyphomicrobiales bacterium]MBV9053771.1 phosphonate ABC transporter, permease protein PhnE [Hyphomicrobiales bacterium]MBV9973804.1 phosphonate ABC transporter, permease protein PhnE [Hyphomicrobiales bacterium]
MRSSRSTFGDLALIAATHAATIRTAERKARQGLGVALVLLTLLVLGLWWIDFGFLRFFAGTGRLGQILWRMLPPSPGNAEHFLLYWHALVETLCIAFIGTLVAAAIALPLGLLAARNVTGSAALHFTLRRCFDIIRGIDRFVWALIFVRVVGLGPFAGTLAIAISNIGSFGKLFSETFEGADPKPVEGVVSTGAHRLHTLRFAILPEVAPVLLSQILYYFESDTRSATVLGIVGAGGIGLYLYEEIRVLEWTHVAFLILMILVTVAGIDALSGIIRRWFIGKRPQRDPRR